LEDRKAVCQEPLAVAGRDRGAVVVEEQMRGDPAAAGVYTHTLRCPRTGIPVVRNAIAVRIGRRNRRDLDASEIHVVLERLDRCSCREGASLAMRSALGHVGELLEERGAERVAADLDGVEAELARIRLREPGRYVERGLGSALPGGGIGGPAVAHDRD